MLRAMTTTGTRKVGTRSCIRATAHRHQRTIGMREILNEPAGLLDELFLRVVVLVCTTVAVTQLPGVLR